jgi:hypothetical protein
MSALGPDRQNSSEHNESALPLKADVRAGSVDFAFGPMSIHLSFRMRRHLLSARLAAPLRPFTPVQLDRRRVFALFLGCQRVAWAFAVDPFGGTTLSIPPLEGFLGWIVLTLAMLVGHDRNMRPIPRGRHPCLIQADPLPARDTERRLNKFHGSPPVPIAAPVSRPPKGHSASLTIRYKLPR